MADALHDEITRLQQLKQEHAGLLHQIASDPGMNPDLRRELVAHIYEEEDEHVAKIAALTTGGLAAHAPLTTPAPEPQPGLSVGSLRPDTGPGAGSGSVGSLRLSAPMIRRGAGSVGSLWRG